MLKFLETCFLSFIILGTPYGTLNPDTYADFQFNSDEINYEEIEADMTHVGIGIGRHTMVQIKSCNFLKEDSVDVLTSWYNGEALENFTFEETVTTFSSTVVSTTEKFSTEITVALTAQVGIPGFSVGTEASVSVGQTIENTTTYTVSQKETFTIRYSAKPEYVEGREFALGAAGDIYKLTWEMWQWDDYWWGDYEVSGSRKECTAYIVADPYVTIVYRDGSFVPTNK